MQAKDDLFAMQAAQFVTFIVWGLTAATGVSIALGMGSKNIQNPPHIASSESAAYSVAHITQLVSASTAPAAAPSAFAGPRSTALQLLGVVYSSDPQQSRALIELPPSQGASKAYGVGSVLPNGAHITAIAQRSVTLAFNATTQTLEIPKE